LSDVSKAQAFLLGTLKTFLPDTPVSSNAIVSPENVTVAKEDKLRIYEFDVSFNIFSFYCLLKKIFFPHLSLAFEYQGEHHYFSKGLFGSSSVSQRRDQAKLKFASQLGVTLIPIPFWWDKSSHSLASTIRYYRPDINFQSKEVPPIPLEMPPDIKYKYSV
jgi:hypothetical protein